MLPWVVTCCLYSISDLCICLLIKVVFMFAKQIVVVVSWLYISMKFATLSLSIIFFFRTQWKSSTPCLQFWTRLPIPWALKFITSQLKGMSKLFVFTALLHFDPTHYSRKGYFAVEQGQPNQNMLLLKTWVTTALIILHFKSFLWRSRLHAMGRTLLQIMLNFSFLIESSLVPVILLCVLLLIVPFFFFFLSNSHIQLS